MSVPDKVVAGDTLEFRVSVPKYPPSDGWSLVYRFTPRFTAPPQSPITLTASVDGDEYVITETPTNTGLWKPGEYGWARWVEKAGARQTLDDLNSRGQLVILPDPSTSQAGDDNRTQAQRAVADLKEALATFRSSGGMVKSYTIGDRQMTFSDEGEILKRLSFWQAELARETKRLRLAAGMANPRHVYVRMDRP